MLLLSTVGDTRRRSDLRVRHSTDGGETWSEGRVAHKGPSAYSQLVLLDASRREAGLFFEAGKSSP